MLDAIYIRVIVYVHNMNHCNTLNNDFYNKYIIYNKNNII